MNHSQLIDRFYSSFSQSDIEGMISCYHDQVVFQDPAFGVLEGDDAKDMWRMLLGRSSGDLQLTYSDIITDDLTGSAKWIAKYLFGPKKRKVTNHISAKFKFKDNKIIDHRDDFDLWKWSGQALGMPGKILGWTPFMKNKIRAQSRSLLKDFQGK